MVDQDHPRMIDFFMFILLDSWASHIKMLLNSLSPPAETILVQLLETFRQQSDDLTILRHI